MAQRLGIVRDASHLPPITLQKSRIERHGCDAIAVIGGSDFVADRRLARALSQLASGDEVVVVEPGVLCRPSGNVAQALRNLIDIGISIDFARNDGLEILPPSASVLLVLEMLAEHDRATAHRRPRNAHQGGSRNPLSKYQIEYARKLYAEGQSLRAISLIFQMAPNQLWKIVAPSDVAPSDSDHDAANPLSVTASVDTG